MISLFFIGLISGSIFLTVLSKFDKALVLNQISLFINDINANKINYLFSLKNSLLSNLSIATLIFILGISIIGLLIAPFIIYFKGFILGFSVSSIILKYGLKGIISAFIYVFPHQIINSLLFIVLTFHSINLSLKLLRSIMSKDSINFKSIMGRYLKIYIVSIVILIMSSLLEVFVNIPLIKICSYFFK